MRATTEFFKDRDKVIPPGEGVMGVTLKTDEKKEPQPPYPWCIGAPTVEDCIRNGYCRRNPNCGE